MKNQFDTLITNFDLLKTHGLNSVPYGLDISEEGIQAALIKTDNKEELVSDDELLKFAQPFGIISLNDFRNYNYGSIEEFREFLQTEYEAENYKKNIGGVGITGRKWEHIENEYPSLIPELKDVYGDVLVIGNGFSPLPLDLLDKSNGISEITVVDLFDPVVVIQQLKDIKSLFNSNNIEFPVKFDRAMDILSAMLENPKIKFKVERVGGDTVEGEFDRLINIAGPEVSLQEMQAMVRPGGKVITNYK